jgi:hypothetical protein
VPDYDFKRFSCSTAPGLVSQCGCAVAQEATRGSGAVLDREWTVAVDGGSGVVALAN